MKEQFSYSRVSCFEKCPYQYLLRYIEKYKTLPDQEANNALYLGLGLHKGIETTVEEGVGEYYSHYYLLTDAHINWAMQLEYQIPRVQELLPVGEHEIKIETDEFVGFIDLVAGDTIYDFKFSNNVDNYVDSPQLSIYKYYYELVTGNTINHLKYVFVPKLMIRQKKTESVMDFRNRLQSELEKTEIKVVEVPYSEDSVSQFQHKINTISTTEDFTKNPTRLCDWCSYQRYCETGDDLDLYREVD